MINVIDCAQSGRMRDFIGLSARCGYYKAEARYIARCACGPQNPLLANGRAAFLGAYEGEEITGRMFAYSDERMKRATGRKLGCFALLDATQPSARALIARAKALQIAWGNTELLGPVSPDGGGFFHGLGRGDFASPRGLFTGADASMLAPVLEDCGFSEYERDDAYYMEIPNRNPYAGLAARASERFGVRVRRVRNTAWSVEWMRAVAELSEMRGDILRQLDRARPWILGDKSFVASANGVCMGYLLSLGARGLPARAATLITRRDAFSKPATLALVSAFADACISGGEKWAEASVITRANEPSVRLIERLGGRVMRTYTRYITNIIEI